MRKYGPTVCFSWLIDARTLLKLQSENRQLENEKKTEDHWSCIAHLIAEDMLKSAVTEEKKFRNTECKWFGPRSVTDLDLNGTHKALI